MDGRADVDRGRRDRGWRDRRRGARHRAGPRRLRGARAGAPDELPRQGPGRGARAAGASRRCSRSTWRSRCSTPAGTTSTRFVPYDEVVDPATAEANAVPLDRLLPGVPGCLDVGHPEACEAWPAPPPKPARPCCAASGTSRSCRATPPTLRYELDDLVTTVSAGLVVGRRRPDVERAPAAGDRAARRPRPARWPAACSSTGSTRGRRPDGAGHRGRPYYFVFPGHTAARGSTCCTTWPSAGGSPGRTGRRRSSTRSACVACPTPGCSAAAAPGRPVRVLPDERQLDRRAARAPGVVLIGDAAGWNDPIIGQGLSIALRDVRMVRRRRPRRPGPLGRRVHSLRAGAAGADAAAARRGGGPDRARRPPSPRPARPAARRSTRSSAPTRCSAARGWRRSWGRRTCRRRRSRPENVARILAMG